MGCITESIRAMKDGRPEDIDWEAVGKFLNEVSLPRILAAIQGKFGGDSPFGVDDPRDLASVVVLWLIEKSRSPEDIPEKIIDRDTLIGHLCNLACDRYRLQFRKQKGHRGGGGPRRGPSALGRDNDGNFRDLDALADPRGGAPPQASAIEDAEEIRALYLALEDLEMWLGRDSDALRIFQDRIQTGVPQKCLAELHGTNETAVSRALQKAQFAVMRRSGYSLEVLARKFPEADRWDREISRSRAGAQAD